MSEPVPLPTVTLSPEFSLAVILGLVALNGLFVMAEFALVAARRSWVEMLRARGHPLAGALAHAQAQLDAYLAATQLGITMASLALGWVGEPALARLFESLLAGLPAPWASVGAHSLALTLAFLVITALHIVFGELTPKSLALQRTELAAMIAVYPTRLVLTLFYPFILLLNGIGNATLRLLGLTVAPGRELVMSVEELKMLVATVEEAGVLEPAEEAIVSEGLEFADLQVRHVMTPRVDIVAVPATTTAVGAIRVCVESGHTRLPVYESDLDRIMGIAHLRDLCRVVVVEGAPDRPVSAIARPPLVVPESAHLDAVLSAMKRQRTQIAIVADEFGGTAGLVTLEDLIEELVGEVWDEFEPPQALIEVLPDGSALVDALATVDDVVDALNVHLPAPKQMTLSRLILTRLRRLPQVGDVMTLDGHRLEVVSVRGRRADRLRFWPATARAAASGPPGQ